MAQHSQQETEAVTKELGGGQSKPRRGEPAANLSTDMMPKFNPPPPAAGGGGGSNSSPALPSPPSLAAQTFSASPAAATAAARPPPPLLCPATRCVARSSCSTRLQSGSPSSPAGKVAAGQPRPRRNLPSSLCKTPPHPRVVTLQRGEEEGGSGGVFTLLKGARPPRPLQELHATPGWEGNLVLLLSNDEGRSFLRDESRLACSNTWGGGTEESPGKLRRARLGCGADAAADSGELRESDVGREGGGPGEALRAAPARPAALQTGRDAPAPPRRRGGRPSASPPRPPASHLSPQQPQGQPGEGGTARRLHLCPPDGGGGAGAAVSAGGERCQPRTGAQLRGLSLAGRRAASAGAAESRRGAGAVAEAPGRKDASPRRPLQMAG